MAKEKQNYNILVVEDNPGDFMLIQEQLLERFENPTIFHATNFKKALTFWLSGAPRPEVVLLDLSLPDKSGEALVNEFLKIASPVPIIILTGFSDLAFSKKSISLGISDYLIKDELNATILFKSILYAIERANNLLSIQTSEKSYSDLFNLSPQPMWLCELKTMKFLQVNKAAIEHYGYSESEFKEMSLLDIRPEGERNDLKIALETVKDDDTSTYSGQYNHLKKTGEIIIVQVYSTPIVINDRYCRSVIAIDLTQRIELEHKITKAIIKTQEEERYDIGSELHDNVCQILATSMMTLGFLKNNIDPEAIRHFDAVKNYITLATNEIRNLSHRLAPAFFDDTSFKESIEGLFNNLHLYDKFSITFLFNKSLEHTPLDNDIQLNLFRILQEQLRNIIKHSNAKMISVVLKPDNERLVMQIADDGVGFNPNTVKSGIGLTNMKRRSELFGGSFKLVTAPTEGCSITVCIPFEKAANEPKDITIP